MDTRKLHSIIANYNFLEYTGGTQVKMRPLKTSEKIIKVDLFSTQYNIGEVLEIGDKAFKDISENPTDAPLFKVGDLVYYVKYAGFNIKKKDSFDVERVVDWRDVRGIVDVDIITNK